MCVELYMDMSLQACVSAIDVITSPTPQTPKGSCPAVGHVLLPLLQCVRTCIGTLQTHPAGDFLQEVLLPIQTACLTCMSSSMSLEPGAGKSHVLPIAHPLYQVASNLFMKSLAAADSNSTVVLIKRLLLWLDCNAAAASAALSAVLLLLECHKQPVLQCVQRMMPHLLRAVVHCLSAHPLTMSAGAADKPQASMPQGGAPEKQPFNMDACCVCILALRCLESMLGQKALLSNLGSEGTRIPLMLVAIARDLARCLQHIDPPGALDVVNSSMLVLAGLCAAATAILRHRDDLVAIMWPLLVSVARLDILVYASACSRLWHHERSALLTPRSIMLCSLPLAQQCVWVVLIWECTGTRMHCAWEVRRLRRCMRPLLAAMVVMDAGTSYSRITLPRCQMQNTDRRH